MIMFYVYMQLTCQLNGFSGLAYMKGVCNEDSYSIQKDFIDPTTFAHELGHKYVYL